MTHQETPSPGQRWRHVNGGVYTIVCRALDEPTLDPVVVYRGEDGASWVRLEELFLERFRPARSE